MQRYTERTLDTEKRVRIVAFFDGQNTLRTANECFGFDRNKQWDYDPRKIVTETTELAEKHLEQIGAPVSRVSIQQIRFYTGVPKHEYDLYGRSYWERLFTRFRNDGIIVVSRDLRYYKHGPAREKGIDLRIGLDMVRMANSPGLCDALLLFSRDTDLREAVTESQNLRARHTGPQQPMYYFCAFPRNADPSTAHGIPGMVWIPIFKEQFERSRYPEPPKVDIEKLLESLSRRHRKTCLRDFDLHAGGKYVTGCFRGCHRVSDDVAVLILETKGDLLVMNVHAEASETLNRYMDINVSVVWEDGGKNRFQVAVQPVVA